MSAQARVETHTPTARWRWGALQRIALLLGWGAFLLVATLQPCCKLSAASPHPVSAEAVSYSPAFDHHGGADHQPADSSDLCADITIANGAALAAAQRSYCTEEATPDYSPPETYAVQQAIYTINAPLLPPPRPLPFHLRTSRLLL